MEPEDEVTEDETTEEEIEGSEEESSEEEGAELPDLSTEQLEDGGESAEESGENSEEEESEDEEDDEVDEEEQKALPSQYHRPVFSEIKSKYPNFFKDFPHMREVYFRENEYAKFAPTIEDAEDQFNKASVFDEINDDLQKGTLGGLIDSLEKNNKPAAQKIIQNFLPDLLERSPQAYEEVVKPVIAYFIRTMYEDGEEAGNENIKAAAQWAAKWGFKTADIEKLASVGSKKVDPEIEKEKERLAKEKQEVEFTRFKEVRGAVVARADKFLLTEISKQVSNVRDKYKRDNATRDIYDKVNEVLTADARHMRTMKSLWLKAQKNGYPYELRNRLVSTVLARAKEVMPAISREIMAQINGSGDKGGVSVKKKKKVIAAKVTENRTESVSSNGKGKVDWAKYPGGGAEYLKHFAETKGKVHRVT